MMRALNWFRVYRPVELCSFRKWRESARRADFSKWANVSGVREVGRFGDVEGIVCRVLNFRAGKKTES